MKSRQEEFDQRVRQHLTGSDPGTGDWDLPSEKVWVSVAERINPEKRRRRGLWWVLGGVSLLFTGILWMSLQKSFPGNLPGTPLQQLENPAQRTTPVKDSIANGAGVQDRQALLDPEPLAFQPEIQNPHTTGPRIQPSKMSLAPEKNVDYPVAPQATNLHHQESIESAEYGEYVEQEKGKDISLPSSTSSETPVSVSPNHAEVTFLKSHVMLLAREAPAFAFNEATPLIKTQRQPGTWSIAAMLSPSLGTRRISVPEAQPRVRRSLLLQQEEATIQPGFGLSVIHQPNLRWSIGLGLEYGSYILNGTSTQQLRYTRAGERRNTRGNFENRLQLNLSTSYGELSTDIVVERSSDAEIEENRFINFAVETKHTMQELRIPLTVGYHLPAGQWKLTGYAGLSANIIVDNTLTFRAVHSLNNEIVHTSTSRMVRLSETRNVVLGYHLGCALEMPLERQWSVLFGPSLSGSIEPVFENRHVKIYPLMADFDLGVRYRF